MICPTCNGTGKTTTKVITFGSNKEESFESTCFLCKGEKEVSEARVKQMEDSEKLWCKCKTTNNEVEYVEDNVADALVSKHHWIHTKCKKLVQIG